MLVAAGGDELLAGIPAEAEVRQGDLVLLARERAYPLQGRARSVPVFEACAKANCPHNPPRTVWIGSALTVRECATAISAGYVTQPHPKPLLRYLGRVQQ